MDPRVQRRRAWSRAAGSIVWVGMLSACGSGARRGDVALHVVPGPAPTVAAHATTIWPVAFHDVRHSGQAAVAGPTTGRIRWVRKLENNVTPGPVVGPDGTIYLASSAGVLHALDPATGVDRWTLDARSPSGGDLSSSPAVLDSGVIVWPAGSNLVGVSRTGRELWRMDLRASLTSPMPFGNRVYVMSMDGVLHAIELVDNGRSATRRWDLALGSGSYATPAIAPDGSIVTNTGNDLVAVQDRGDRGRERWRRDLGVLSEISPAIAPDGTIVSGGNDRWIQTFTAEGRPVDRYDREAQSYSSPIVSGAGVVFQGNHQAAIVAVDLHAQHHRLVVRRSVRHRGRSIGVWTAPVVDRDANIYFGTRSGQIVGFTWSGRLLFDIDAGATATIDSYPAITSDGALIVGDTDGVVRAIADDGTLPHDARPHA